MQGSAASQIVPFQFEAMTVRAVIGNDGEPMFVARDVALTLGYLNVNDAITRHCKGVVKHDLLTGRGIQAVSLIPERDVYRLVMRSKLPSAERFTDWVVGEVLPSIRKTGGFQEKFNVPQTMSEALRLAADLTDQNIALRETVAEQEPKVNALRRIAEAEGSFCLTDAAKMLKLAPRQFFEYMQANGYIFKRPGCAVWLGYQDKVQAGLLVHKSTVVTRDDGTEKVAEQVRITGRGIARIAEKLDRAATLAGLSAAPQPQRQSLNS